jgi:opacity protein-like surface antigen
VRTAQPLCAALVIVCALPAAAAAQARMPHKDAGAFGGDVGVFLPKQDGMTTGAALEGFYEYYITARESVRVGVGWANPKFDGEGNDSVRHVRLAVDLVRNWERGSVHPFVGAGLGTYFLQPRDNGNDVGESRTKLGGTLFGGVEFFTSNTLAVKGEARYHIVSKADGFDPSGLALTVGLKSYF